MKWLWRLLAAIFRFFANGDTELPVKEAKGPGAREKRLKAKLRRDGWKVVLVFWIFAAGCIPPYTDETEAIYVPSGTAVRLRADVTGARVWVIDEAGTPERGIMTLPAGWYVLPDEGGDDD